MSEDDERPEEGSSLSKLRRELSAQERVGDGPPVKRLPPRGWSRAITFGVCYVIIMSAFAWAADRSSADIPVLGIGVGLAAVLAFLCFHRNCPCGGRLIPRHEPAPDDPGRARLFYDCARCRTVWDSGEFVEEAEKADEN